MQSIFSQNCSCYLFRSFRTFTGPQIKEGILNYSEQEASWTDIFAFWLWGWLETFNLMSVPNAKGAALRPPLFLPGCPK
jgi:hypothetical protein